MVAQDSTEKLNASLCGQLIYVSLLLVSVLLKWVLNKGTKAYPDYTKKTDNSETILKS